MTQKQYLATTPAVFIADKRRATQKPRLAQEPLPVAPAESLSLPEQNRRLRLRLQALEDQNRTLRKENGELRRENETMRRQIKAIHRKLDVIPV